MGAVGQGDGEGWLALDGRMDAQDPDLGGSKRVNPTISPNCPPRESLSQGFLTSVEDLAAAPTPVPASPRELTKHLGDSFSPARETLSLLFVL